VNNGDGTYTLNFSEPVTVPTTAIPTQNILMRTPGGGGWLTIDTITTGTSATHDFLYEGGNTDCDLVIIAATPIGMSAAHPFMLAMPTTPIP
jgi:hypothetical protein